MSVDALQFAVSSGKAYIKTRNATCGSADPSLCGKPLAFPGVWTFGLRNSLLYACEAGERVKPGVERSGTPG